MVTFPCSLKPLGGPHHASHKIPSFQAILKKILYHEFHFQVTNLAEKSASD